MLIDKGLVEIGVYQFQLWESDIAMIPERFRNFASVSTCNNHSSYRIGIEVDHVMNYFYVLSYVNGAKFFLLQQVGLELRGLSSITYDNKRWDLDYNAYGKDNFNTRINIAIKSLPTFEEYNKPLTGDIAIVQLPEQFKYSPNVGGARQTYTQCTGKLAWCYNTRCEEGRLLVYFSLEGIEKTFSLHDEDLVVIRQWHKEDVSLHNMYRSGKLLFNYELFNENKYNPRARLSVEKSYTSPINNSFRNLVPVVKGQSTYGTNECTWSEFFVEKKLRFVLEEIDPAFNILNEIDVPRGYVGEHTQKYDTVKSIALAYSVERLSIAEFLALSIEQLAEKWSTEFNAKEEAKRKTLALLYKQVDYTKLTSHRLGIDNLLNLIKDCNSKVQNYEAEIGQRYYAIKQLLNTIESYQKQWAIAKGYLEDNTSEQKIEHLKQLMSNGFFEFRGQENNTLYFLSQDIVQHFNGDQINTGKMVVVMRFSESLIKNFITIHKYSGFKESSNWHTHISSGGTICWGDSLPFVTTMYEQGNFVAILSLLQSLLTSHSPSNPYIGWETLKLTEYANDASTKRSWDSSFDTVLSKMSVPFDELIEAVELDEEGESNEEDMDYDTSDNEENNDEE